jgi:hypothetical protein
MGKDALGIGVAIRIVIGCLLTAFLLLVDTFTAMTEKNVKVRIYLVGTDYDERLYIRNKSKGIRLTRPPGGEQE